MPFEFARENAMVKKSAVVMSVCACFIAAMGAGLKYTSFTAEGPGITENPQVDGVAKVKYQANREENDFHLTISDLQPGTTYGVLVENLDTGTGFADGAAFTTNPQGHGTFQATFGGGDVTATSNVQVIIFLYDGDFDTLMTVTPLEIRASANLSQ
jgi:hypothetical protein